MLGSRKHREGMARALPSPGSLLGTGESRFLSRDGSPRSSPSAGEAPLPILAEPKRGRPVVPLRLLRAAHAQLFVCSWSFSLLRKKARNRQQDGAVKGEALASKRCTFAAGDRGRNGFSAEPA